MKNLMIKFATIFALLFWFGTNQTISQESKPYDPGKDGKQQISEAIAEAGESGKHVFVMIGGNWCPWCLRFHKFIHEDQTIDSLLKADYVFTMLNYSKENKNEDVLVSLGYPQRFGFPVL